MVLSRTEGRERMDQEDNEQVPFFRLAGRTAPSGLAGLQCSFGPLGGDGARTGPLDEAQPTHGEACTLVDQRNGESGPHLSGNRSLAES